MLKIGLIRFLISIKWLVRLLEFIKGVFPVIIQMKRNFRIFKDFEDHSILGNGGANYFRMFSRNYWKEVGQNLSLEVYINK